VNDIDFNNVFAALDLGSNSFHLVIARHEPGGSWVVLDRLREMVRLADGLDEHKNLAPEARQRALDCLARMGERLRPIPARNLRIVGTSTLRQARAAGDFIADAESALDHPIDIISGMEEARLIYLGVARGLPAEGRHLVMDIGGGSTEFIVGEGMEPLSKAGLHMGCVGHSRRHFADGRISRAAFEAAETAARVELEPIEERFRRLSWESAVGASGTIKAVSKTLQERGWTDGTITPDGLDRLRKDMIKSGQVDKLDLPGVKKERYPVLAGGLAILRAAFSSLGIAEMRLADGALREGILLDLPERVEHADSRAASVARLAERFHADPDQAQRVATTAADLYAQACGPWALGEEGGWLLEWAARLHEIGLDISYSSCHKHAAYIVANTDLDGFADAEQRQLATLVRAWRRKFPADDFAQFGKRNGSRMARLAVLLRLAAVLHRGRHEEPLPPLELHVDGTDIEVDFPQGWLDGHPLTRADLDEEARLLDAGGFRLTWNGQHQRG
jgi:exopolyphosphatase/guanosine-5'-triphosphate,3'-diphosphate pyrophosphatase